MLRVYKTRRHNRSVKVEHTHSHDRPLKPSGQSLTLGCRWRLPELYTSLLIAETHFFVCEIYHNFKHDLYFKFFLSKIDSPLYNPNHSFPSFPTSLLSQMHSPWSCLQGRAGLHETAAKKDKPRYNKTKVKAFISRLIIFIFKNGM